MAGGGTLGIVAGGGELPIAVAESARDAGRSVFLVALKGMAAETDVAPFPHEWVSIGEAARVVKVLKGAGCFDVTVAGKVSRPDYRTLKVDALGALAVPKLIAAGLKGDDALLRAVIGLFEKEGLRFVGTTEAAPDLVMRVGVVGRHKPNSEHQADIALGARVVRAMGAHDIGQAAAVCEGLVLAVEAAEGTDAMIDRIASLPETIRGTPKRRRGVLVKAPKPKQERRVDLPVVGTRTVERVAEVGLAGIALEAGGALLMNRRKLAESADRLGLFIFGFEAGAFRD